ncbi:MAG: iron ABC transporter [Deltaproteobacteria bacterium]|nr:MAG: iron ABC transporter [Desulfobacterales bacterium]PIE73811.1 MAG: iron ABC transporter [Deltaproteobacteria bacterium]
MTEATVLNCQGLSFAYGEEPVLRDVNLELQRGLLYGIIGPNGSGKTTLLDLCTGSKRPSTGEIRLLSRPLRTFSAREKAQQIALVPQEYRMDLGFTVTELVLMGRHPYIPRFGSPSAEDWRQVQQAIDDIGITDIADRSTSHLSGGQKQRVVVARALAQNTPILLLDEATANLDIQYTLQIFNLSRNLVKQKNRTVLAVVHDLNLAAAYCDALIVMEKGKVVVSGPTENVLDAGTIKQVFGVESRIYWDAYNQTKQISFLYGGKNR